MIKVDNLSREFGHQKAVDNLSFEINPGDIVGFLGPNGAGKSTTMKMITGFLPATAGKIQVAGHDIENAPLEAKKRIGYLPEGAPAYPDMTVYQFLHFIAAARKIPKSSREEAIKRVVSQVDLTAVLNKTIDNLSKGFKRRVGIAQALIHDPDILILDEPTDGLDPNQKHQVRELIASLAENKIVIVSTHILEEVTAVCNRVIIIANGQKKFDDTPQALLRRSRYFNAITIGLSYIADISGLLELEGVADMQHDRSNNLITVFPRDQQDISAVLHEYVQKNKLPIEYMYPEQGRLDDVFREITTSTDNKEVA
ncbi:ABC transporter ATP-binding protein [Glaciecola sp. 1036]|uniref:ABC transporter ATP-binding protein n=1 Tax=Alteromonadaceae TaxID=72275 RepID=UPI003D0406A8